MSFQVAWSGIVPTKPKPDAGVLYPKQRIEIQHDTVTGTSAGAVVKVHCSRQIHYHHHNNITTITRYSPLATDWLGAKWLFQSEFLLFCNNKNTHCVSSCIGSVQRLQNALFGVNNWLYIPVYIYIYRYIYRINLKQNVRKLFVCNIPKVESPSWQGIPQALTIWLNRGWVTTRLLSIIGAVRASWIPFPARWCGSWGFGSWNHAAAAAVAAGGRHTWCGPRGCPRRRWCFCRCGIMFEAVKILLLRLSHDLS